MNFPTVCTMNRAVRVALVGACIVVGAPVFTHANVITDWDEKGISAVRAMANLGGTNPYLAQRMMALVHVAMFDAVNSVERRYRPYLAGH